MIEGNNINNGIIKNNNINKNCIKENDDINDDDPDDCVGTNNTTCRLGRINH